MRVGLKDMQQGVNILGYAANIWTLQKQNKEKQNPIFMLGARSLLYLYRNIFR